MVCKSSTGLLLHKRYKHRPEDLPINPNQVPCEFEGCEGVFPTRTGMRQHIRHRHPELMDETTNTERVKERWTEEETRMLARREAELLVQQEREGRRININISLQAAFPRRTLESAKGHTRYTMYKRIVAQMADDIREGLLERQPIRRRGRRSLILDPPMEVTE